MFKYAKKISDDRTKVLCETKIDDYDQWPFLVQWLVILYNGKLSIKFLNKGEYFVPNSKLSASMKEASVFIKSTIQKDQKKIKKLNWWKNQISLGF